MGQPKINIYYRENQTANYFYLRKIYNVPSDVKQYILLHNKFYNLH